MTEELYRRLRCMHAHHLRAMCRVSRSQAWEHHISAQELGQRLGLDSIEFYIARRQLRWLGDVSRMPYETRLPRRLLSAWVPHRRPIGSPSMTYGRSIFKALEMFRIDKTRWPELAANRSAWRETLRTGVAPPPRLLAAGQALSRTKLPRSSAQQTQAKMNESLRRSIPARRGETRRGGNRTP